MHWSGERAALTLNHANKEDEGLYTLRVVMGDYYEEYSAYVFVRGKYCLVKEFATEMKKTCWQNQYQTFEVLFFPNEKRIIIFH